jgi:hypothetical protein
MLETGGYKSFAEFGQHVELFERAQEDFITVCCRNMQARQDFTQNLFGFQNWTDKQFFPNVHPTMGM